MDIRFPPNTLEIFSVCCTRQVCRPDIETGIKLIQGLYYLKSLPCWYWYKAGMASMLSDVSEETGMASSHTSEVQSLLPVL
jgi:hypothetical protein